MLLWNATLLPSGKGREEGKREKETHKTTKQTPPSEKVYKILYVLHNE